MHNAYIIGHVTIKDPVKWDEYRARVSATLEPWGAQVVFRGKLASVLSGNHAHMNTVVIGFPDLEALNSWHASAEYQLLIPLRQEAALVELISYEV